MKSLTSHIRVYIYIYISLFCIFVLQTAEALQKALEKDKVYIKGVRIRKEPSSSTPKIPDRNGNVNPLTVDFAQSRVSDNSPGSFLGPSKSKGIRRTGYSVAVEDVPLHIPLTEVKEALSKYGEIAHSSRKKEGHGGYIANVEFKVNVFQAEVYNNCI